MSDVALVFSKSWKNSKPPVDETFAQIKLQKLTKKIVELFTQLEALQTELFADIRLGRVLRKRRKSSGAPK